MSLRRVSLAVALVCGLCVWAAARPGDGPPATSDPAPDDNRDEAESRYRNSQSRHWRHVALGSTGSR